MKAESASAFSDLTAWLSSLPWPAWIILSAFALLWLFLTTSFIRDEIAVHQLNEKRRREGKPPFVYW